jgi:4'-phosphopantetheinyl transferase
VVAFSYAHPVGIDVEPLDRDADTEALVKRVCTEAEQRHWRRLPETDQPRLFLRVWTCKEAFLKAIGAGLQRAPKTVECLFDGDKVVGLTDANEYRPSSPMTSAAHWALRSFPASDRACGAIVRRRSLPPSPVFADAGRLVHQLSTP